jgi:hypothetical protein
MQKSPQEPGVPADTTTHGLITHICQGPSTRITGHGAPKKSSHSDGLCQLIQFAQRATKMGGETRSISIKCHLDAVNQVGQVLLVVLRQGGGALNSAEADGSQESSMRVSPCGPYASQIKLSV